MAILIAVGSSATIDNFGGSTPTNLTNLISIGGNTSTMSMADVSGVADSTLAKLPARIDPGTVQLTFFLDDTATATNQLTALKTRMTGKTKSVIAVNLPGSSVDTLLTWTGYITEVTTPEVGASDDAMRYTVTLTVSAA